MSYQANENKIYYVPALKHNLKAINVIHENNQLPTYDLTFIESVKQHFPKFTSVIVYDNLPVGFISCTLENFNGQKLEALPVGKKNHIDIQLHINDICILKNYQHYHIGTIALQHMIKSSKEISDIKRAVVSIKDENEVLDKFLTSNSFEKSSNGENQLITYVHNY